MAFLTALMFSLSQSAPYIIIGYLVAAFVKEFVPVGVLTRYFGDKGVRPLLHAVGVGAILPICSCGVIPLGVGAFKCGSSRGTTLTFMTSAPTIAPVAVLLSVSLLGWYFTLIYFTIALIGSVIIGMIGNWLLGGAKEVEFRATHCKLEEGESIEDSKNWSLPAKLRGALKWAFWDLGSDVSMDLLFGISLAAAILAFIPVDWISGWLGRQSFVTLIYVILIAIPMYTCSTPSIPIVQSLLLKGVSPGAAVAYLIVGPSTNFAELAAIRSSMGKGAAALFGFGLLIVAILGGLLTDFVFFSHYTAKSNSFGSEYLLANGEAMSLHAAFVAIPVWHYPFMALLLVTLIFGAFRKVTELSKKWNKRDEALPLSQNVDANTSRA